MHLVHAGYTLTAPLETDRVEAVRQLLADCRADPARLPFADVATVHFASIAVIPAQRWGDEELPASILFATSFCGPSRAHVAELVRVAGRGLREVFASCEGFRADCGDAELARFIRAHRRSNTFYSAMHGLTRADVLRQQTLRDAIETYVDDRQRAGDLPSEPVAVREQIQGFVRGRPDLAWADRAWDPAPGTFLALHWRTLLLYATVLPFLAALLVSSLLLIFVHSAVLGAAVASGWLVVDLALLTLAGLIAGTRDAELQQIFVAGRLPDAHVRAIHATQSHPVINEMTVAGPIKEGLVRPVVLRLALWIVARVAEGLPGVRGGITIPTVATARWIALDRGRRLVFISNYTNASEPYVRDFIDTSAGAMRINLTFGFGRGYPRTDWVIWRGALDDPNGFIHVVNANQRPTEYWFCPYRNLSIDNIKINRRICEGLFGPCTPDEAHTWCQLL